MTRKDKKNNVRTYSYFDNNPFWYVCRIRVYKSGIILVDYEEDTDDVFNLSRSDAALMLRRMRKGLKIEYNNHASI